MDEVKIDGVNESNESKRKEENDIGDLNVLDNVTETKPSIVVTADQSSSSSDDSSDSEKKKKRREKRKKMKEKLKDLQEQLEEEISKSQVTRIHSRCDSQVVDSAHLLVYINVCLN